LMSRVAVWALRQLGPMLRERRGQLFRAVLDARLKHDERRVAELIRQLRELGPENRDMRLQQRAWASWVLDRELAGRPEEARRLRAQLFSRWRPPDLPAGDPDTLLARVLSNLQNYEVDPEVPRRDMQLYARLADRLKSEAAAKGTAAALELVRSLPILGERLLSKPAEKPPAEKTSPQKPAAEKPPEPAKASGGDSAKHR
jgi:hypothetical protein